MIDRNQLILLIEDDANDVFFMERALKQAQIENPLRVARDGSEALDYLQGNGAFADRSKHPLPSVIFLDLKLPYANGFRILDFVRNDPQLSIIPVYILTSSPEERDRKRATELGIAGYLIKPPDKDMILKAFNSDQRQFRVSPATSS